MNEINANPRIPNHLMVDSRLSQKTKLLSYTILLAAVVGIWICGSLLKVHDGGWTFNTENATLLAMPCLTSTTSTSSCGAVTSSRWGSFDFFVGKRRVLIPTSLIGLVYFSAIFLWFTLQPTPLRWTRRLWLVTMIVQSCAILASFFWLVVMVKSSDGWCSDCLVAHLVNVVIFASTIWLRQTLASGTAPNLTVTQIQQTSPFGLSPVMVSMTIVFVSFGVWLYFDATTAARHFWRRHAVLEKLTSSLQHDPSFVLREFYAQPISAELVEANDDRLTAAVTGNADAQLTVFTNYESRASRCFEATLGGHVRDAFGRHINVDFRHLPVHSARAIAGMSGLNNRMASQENVSCQAAVAAYVEGGFQAFAAMRTKLLVSRSHHTRTDIARMATSIGLNSTSLLARLDKPNIVQRIARDCRLAEALGIDSAPAAYLNGRRVPALCLNSEVFWKAISKQMTAQANATLSH